MIIVDAGCWVLALVEAGPVGSAARDLMSADPDWMAPAHTTIEVLRTIRRYETNELIDRDAATSSRRRSFGPKSASYSRTSAC